MNREYHRWKSPQLGREMELLTFGCEGMPLLVFPTSKGRFYDFEDRGMIHAIDGPIASGRAYVVCVDSVDAESWYNKDVPPRQRVERHLAYERYVLQEVVPFIKARSRHSEIGVAGCSFGGYHAVNISLRHPDVMRFCLSLGGAFDIKQFIDGYYDEDCYFNNPVDYLPNLNDAWYLDRCRTGYRMILGTGECDLCLEQNRRLSELLDRKAIPHVLDVWGDGAAHDWPWWQRMIAKFVA